VSVRRLELDGLLLLEPEMYADNRGFFVERVHEERLAALGIPSFVQTNQSHSHAGVLRGLHFQVDPPQGKLIAVVQGTICDVAVDIRPGSATFGRHCTIELSARSGQMLWIPGGFAHGFCVLDQEPADVFYWVDVPYNAQREGGIHWADPELAIHWPLRDPVLSARDSALPSFAEYRAACISLSERG
jgi:dTDP-4-dehydrorhamnose 3,5-epimerase